MADTVGDSHSARVATYARAEETVCAFRQLLRHQMRQSTLFVMACDRSDQDREREFEAAYRCLQGFTHKKQALTVVMLELTPQQAGFLDWNSFPDTVVFRCLALDTAASETMRDKLKEALWQFRTTHSHRFRDASSTPTNRQAVEQTGQVTPLKFRLRDFGVFSPAAATKNMKPVRTHSFQHGAGHFYRYRVATPKLPSAGHSWHAVSEYLGDVFEDCPNHLFRTQPRISAQKLATQVPFAVSTDHDIIRMAAAGSSSGRYKSAHDNVEVYLLENDPKTIACEVPLWVERGELQTSGLVTCPLEWLTGHIDVLRHRGETVEIWDYKPRASLEQYAGGQVLLYAMVFSVRTGCPLSQIVVGYFDENEAYFCSAHQQKIIAAQDWISSRTD